MKTPDTTLRPATHLELIRQVEAPEVRARMFEAERRRQILEDDWRPLVYARMQDLGYDWQVLAALQRRVKTSSNVAAKVLRKVCLAYRQPPMRSITGSSDEAQRAFRSLVLEQAKLNTLPQSWERRVWLMNRAITVPVVYPSDAHPFGQRLAYETLDGSNTEVVTADGSPTAEPIASITCLIPHGANRWQRKHYLILDHVGWWTYDHHGYLLSVAPHGAGVWPGTVWRRSHGSDWWQRSTGLGLVEATIEVAHIAARLNWIRQGQDHNREMLITERASQIPMQVAGSDKPLHVPLPKDEFEYIIKDAKVSIDEHVKHMVTEARDGVESVGIDPDLLDYREGTEGLDVIVAAQKHDELVALRAATTEHFRLAERDSAVKTAKVLRGARHPQSRLLPPEQIEEHFEAHWSELDFVDHPADRLEVLEHEIDLGLKSRVDAYMALHRGKSREQAKAELQRIAEEESDLADILVTRNVPGTLRDRIANLAQLQGRIGGMVGGDNRNLNANADADPSPAPRTRSRRAR